MSLVLTPPPTVMVFFKEISLKNESTEQEDIKTICHPDIIFCQHSRWQIQGLNIVFISMGLNL